MDFSKRNTHWNGSLTIKYIIALVHKYEKMSKLSKCIYIHYEIMYMMKTVTPMSPIITP